MSDLRKLLEATTYGSSIHKGYIRGFDTHHIDAILATVEPEIAQARATADRYREENARLRATGNIFSRWLDDIAGALGLDPEQGFSQSDLLNSIEKLGTESTRYRKEAD